MGNTVASLKDLTSTIADAEENSGVRVLKFSPLPNQDEFKERFNPDCPVIRLTEIYYTLADVRCVWAIRMVRPISSTPSVA